MGGGHSKRHHHHHHHHSAPVVQKTREQLVQEARSSLPGFDPSKRNVAICGCSGTGKSTMVNALQGIRDGDPGAAKVDEVECTADITSYPSGNTNLVVWDLPGCGTDRHPFEGYFENKKLYAFDGLILTYNSRLDENTVALYRQCVERQVSVMLVRTQADRAFDAKVRRMSPEQANTEMHADFAKELSDLSLVGSTNAFYVSMWDYADGKSKMDEQKFVDLVLQTGSG
ncbi:hypothetical protein BASA81_000976 [Batrachochytrium salamandrivorans]|nr:hypothetical protein BASA81_000976 [Batrachochytrium salamandrivorans]